MSNTGGPLQFDAVIRDSNFSAQIDRMERRLMGLTTVAVRETQKVDDTFRRLGQLAGGAFLLKGLSDLPQQLFAVRGEFQQLEIAFTAMLRSKAKSDALIGEIKEFALTTPYGVTETAQAAKQLLAYGFAAQSITKDLRTLGDVSSGVGQPLSELVRIYGQLRTQGRAYATDIRELSGRGVPILNSLASVLSINVDQVSEFVSAGKVGFKEVEAAFKSMTTGAGMFSGLMEAQSKSLVGLVSQLGDAWDAALNDIGQQNEGLAADVLRGTTSLVQNYQQVLDILKVVTVAYGSYKGALVLASVAQLASSGITRQQAINNALAASSSHSLTLSQVRQAASTSLVARAQAALNTTMLANPYALVFTALAALTTAYFVFKEEAVQVKSAQELIAEASGDIAKNVNQEKTEIDSLVSVLKNQNIAESERLKAYNRLREISPDIVAGLDFQKAKTSDLTKSVEAYVVALEKSIRVEAGRSKIKAAADQEFAAEERLRKKEEAFLKKKQAADQKSDTRNAGQGTAGGGTGSNFQKSSELAQAQKELDEAAEGVQKARAVTAEVKKGFESVLGEGTRQSLEAQRSILEQKATQLDKSSKAYKLNEDLLIANKKQLDALNKSEKDGQVIKAKTLDQLDKEIKDKKESLNTGLSRAAVAKIQADIEGLEAQKRRLTGKRTPEENKAVKAAEKAGAVGSAQYYEDIAKKASETLEKTSKADTAAIAKQVTIRDNALRQAEEARKAYEIKSFEEGLDKKREQYEVYQRWVTAYGETAADAQFSDLIKNGQTYLDYLNTQIAGLENERDNAGLSDKQTLNLDSLIQNKKGILDSRPTDQFTESLAKAKEEAGSLTSHLEYLYQEQEKLGKVRNSPDAIGNRVAVSKAIVQTENEVRDGAAKFLASYAGSEQQATAIKQRYTDLRLGIEKRFGKDQSTEKTKSIDIINKAEAEETKAFKDSQFQQSEEYKKLNRVILEEGRKRLAIEIDNLEKALAKAEESYGKQGEEYKKLQLELRGKKREQAGGLFTDISTAVGIAQQFGDALSGMGGEAGESGQRLLALASQVSLLNQAFKKGLSAEEAQANAIQVGVQGVIGFVTALTSAAAERKRVEENFYTSVNNQQREYILLQNQQLGLKGKNNIFYKDYEGELRSGFTKYADAQKKYQAALAKLNEGKAKSGLTNTLDGKTALGMVGGAAATGAGIGTLIAPGIGTLIGGAIGGIVGGIGALFGGAQKKQEEFVGLLKQYPDLLKMGSNGVSELNKELATSLLNSELLDENTKGLIRSTLDWAAAAEEAKAQIREVVSSLASGLGDNLRDGLVDAFEQGTSAAEAFQKSVEAILQDMATKILFSKAFGPAFDQLEQGLTDALSGNGDYLSTFVKFGDDSKVAIEQYNRWLTLFKESAKNSGFDVLLNPNANTSKTAMRGAIAGITETQAGVLEGQLNGMRITQAQTQLLIRDQLLHLANIDRSTSNIDLNTAATNNKLDRIYDALNKDSLRAKGLPG